MKLHTDILALQDIIAAARIARVDFRHDSAGSRIRQGAYVVHLTGESNRRPNGGRFGADSDDYAATWDQWGVFFAVLFERDPNMVAGSGLKHAAYNGAADFHRKTADRFAGHVAFTRDGEPDGVTYWPADAHGDHTFRWSGGVSQCTKCSAIDRRWS